MFEQVFKKLHETNPEIRCIGVWGKDGLELERMVFADFALDLDLLGAQIADIVNKFDGLKLDAQHCSIRMDQDNYYLAVFSLTRDYFMVVVADPTIIPGRLQFYLDMQRAPIHRML